MQSATPLPLSTFKRLEIKFQALGIKILSAYNFHHVPAEVRNDARVLMKRQAHAHEAALNRRERGGEAWFMVK